MARSVSEKMSLKQGMHAIFVHAPEEAIRDIDPPTLALKSTLTGEFDYIHLFALSQAVFHEYFPKLKQHLKQTGMLWVSWPKARQQGTDLTLTTVIKIGYDYGLVESTSLSINLVWSALKFTHPKKGKTYANSYGKLKQNDS
jgi:hypothetical protein